MFESLVSDARGPARHGASVAASLCMHGLFIGLAAAITYVRTRLPGRADKGVEVSFRPLPPAFAGHNTRPQRVTRAPVAPKVRPQIIIQPRQIPKGVAPGARTARAANDEPLLLRAGMSRPQPAGDCAPSGSRSRPLVPAEARALDLGGKVRVEYVVRTDGSVSGVSLQNPGAPRLLFEATRKWLEACPFSPSTQGGRPVPVRVVQQFNFRLE